MNAEKAEYERELAEIKDELGEISFQTAWQEGQSLDLDDAVLLATEGASLPTAR
jgi:hypothetical protein